jgi:NADH-quinone oxidoreductase subunit C|tara:strand:- start:97 stop:591 length:495 start_codon:yes stop_codon:yes gene_type:complete
MDSKKFSNTGNIELLDLLGEIFSGFPIQLSVESDEITVNVKPNYIRQICRISKTNPLLDCDYLRCISVVDYKERLEVNYHLYSLSFRHKFMIKVAVSIEDPRVPSVEPVWRAAEWFEREGHDLYGVEFTGHPNPMPLLLWDGFEFEGYQFPGRKEVPFYDYKEW